MTVGKTKSLCPVCLRLLDAEKGTGRDGNIYLKKRCPEHGEFSVLIWEGDVESYVRWGTESVVTEPLIGAKAEKDGCPYDCGLCEKHLRKGCCMLLELTKRCNLRCPVCFASAGEGEARDMSMEEIKRQYDFLMAHGGPFNIQLSGGEPTVRDDLEEIITLGQEKGFPFFQLNTNGLRLAEEKGYAERLYDAGLNTVFLQFDSLSDGVYEILRGRALLREKRRAIENCAAAGLGVVLVPVIAPGINDGELGALLHYGLENMPAVRGVHFQPISYFGRCALTRPERPMTIPRMLRLIEEQSGGAMRAEDFRGGSAENPYCSFHASYLRDESGALRALAPKSGDGCCGTSSDDARGFVARQWAGERETGCCTDGGCCETSALDAFLTQMHRNTFAVSGMLFQDAMTVDLERLRRCHICEVDSEHGMVPFCAYNLTDSKGRALYRK